MLTMQDPVKECDEKEVEPSQGRMETVSWERPLLSQTKNQYPFFDRFINAAICKISWCSRPSSLQQISPSGLFAKTNIVPDHPFCNLEDLECLQKMMYKTALIAKRVTCLDCSNNLKQQKVDHIICGTLLWSWFQIMGGTNQWVVISPLIESGALSESINNQ